MDWELWILIAITLLGLLLGAMKPRTAHQADASAQPPFRFSISSMMFWTALVALLLNLILDIPKTCELRRERKDLEFRVDIFGPLIEHDRVLLETRIANIERDHVLDDDVATGLMQATNRLQSPGRDGAEYE